MKLSRDGALGAGPGGAGSALDAFAYGIAHDLRKPGVSPPADRVTGNQVTLAGAYLRMMVI